MEYRYLQTTKIPVHALVADLNRVAELLREQSVTRDQYRKYGRFSYKPFYRAFGSWNSSLKHAELSINRRVPLQLEECPAGTRRAQRLFTDRERFQILKRDRFRCKLCGASPATNPTVELEVDHIIPFSKGGPTTIENGQTLCHRCNRHKGDSIILKPK